MQANSCAERSAAKGSRSPPWHDEVLHCHPGTKNYCQIPSADEQKMLNAVIAKIGMH